MSRKRLHMPTGHVTFSWGMPWTSVRISDDHFLETCAFVFIEYVQRRCFVHRLAKSHRGPVAYKNRFSGCDVPNRTGMSVPYGVHSRSLSMPSRRNNC